MTVRILSRATVIGKTAINRADTSMIVGFSIAAGPQSQCPRVGSAGSSLAVGEALLRRCDDGLAQFIGFFKGGVDGEMLSVRQRS